MKRDTWNASELKAYAASVCGKFCSRVIALTNRIPENEAAHCDSCIHWNNDRCIRFNELTSGYKNMQGDEEGNGRNLCSMQRS